MVTILLRLIYVGTQLNSKQCTSILVKGTNRESKNQCCHSITHDVINRLHGIGRQALGREAQTR